MRIFVKAEGKRRFVLWVPTFLVLNHLTALFIPSVLRKVAGKKNCPYLHLSVGDMMKIVSIYYRMRLRHPTMPLAEIKIRERCGDGVFVKI